MSGPVTSSAICAGSSSVTRSMYRAGIPRNVGRFTKFAAIAVTQSSASGGGTDALSACSSWTPERSKVEAATMAAEHGAAPQDAKKFAPAAVQRLRT